MPIHRLPMHTLLLAPTLVSGRAPKSGSGQPAQQRPEIAGGPRAVRAEIPRRAEAHRLAEPDLHAVNNNLAGTHALGSGGLEFADAPDRSRVSLCAFVQRRCNRSDSRTIAKRRSMTKTPIALPHR
jgi:hypothetical protein